MDAWLDATDELVPGNHSANDTPAWRPFTHMTGPGGDVLLRQWPEGTPKATVTKQANVLNAMHQAAGDVIPSVITKPGKDNEFTTTVKDRFYTAQTWLPYSISCKVASMTLKSFIPRRRATPITKRFWPMMQSEWIWYST